MTIIQRQTTFRHHLLAAIRDVGNERPIANERLDTLLFAFPEFVLGKWFRLAFGADGTDRRLVGGTAPAFDPVWRHWHDEILGQTQASNLGVVSSTTIVIAHGLSPIEDTTFLLAEMGRAARAARAIRANLRTMLADVSWITHNRSIRQFGVEERALEDGLRVCRDRRLRLYEALSVRHTAHSILPYPRPGMIHQEKLAKIANHYRDLVDLVWGSEYWDTQVPLSDLQVRSLCRSLSRLPSGSPLSVLASFPSGLESLETSLRPHLDVVREIAKRFRMMNNATFSYFFAQYYAQDGYRGSCIKIAPISERSFDEPFDSLDECFRAWGEGHDPALPSERREKRRRHKRLAAIYLPQYSIAGWATLPYTPLSLDSVTRGRGSLEAVRAQVPLISDCTIDALPKLERLTRASLPHDVVALNRLACDLLSFIAFATSKQGQTLVDVTARDLGVSFTEILEVLLGEAGPESYAIEADPDVDLAALWRAWLDFIEPEKQAVGNYAPWHLSMAARTPDDWSATSVTAFSKLVVLANAIGQRLTT